MDSMLFHPKLVHLPIALAVLMPLVAGGLLIAWWRQWLPGRAWVIAVLLQLLLVGSGVLALQSGEADEERVERVVAETHISAHEHAAKRFVLASAGVLGLMLVGAALSRKRSGLGIAAASVAGTLGVLALGYQTGEAGGRLVYTHGAAAAFSSENFPGDKPTVRAAGAEHDDDD
ncbi:MAG: hypothetical protein H6718_27305 [Polyangiaceae bacterium]|nr:hypothetical protein [Myxococcales bacterium]MCB9589152.1 hypothetical protein [Polyangiaceae bacterium]MCB9610012.1 hypothetical protein [Polyangiaceae bacterium]